MAKKSTKRSRHAALTRRLRPHYQSLLNLQNGLLGFPKDQEICPLCQGERKPEHRRFHFDTDHKTEGLRGLLCGQCNRRLKFYLTPAWLRRAADYLEDPPLTRIVYDPDCDKRTLEELEPGVTYAWPPPNKKGAPKGSLLSPQTTIAEEEP